MNVLGRSPGRRVRALQVLTLMLGMSGSVAFAQSDELPSNEPKAAEAKAPQGAEPEQQTKAQQVAEAAPPPTAADAQPAAPAKPALSAELAKPAPAAMSAELAKPGPRPAPAAMSAELAKPVPQAPAAVPAEIPAPAPVMEQQPQVAQTLLVQPVQQGPRTIRNLVVPHFTGPSTRVRTAVLGTLADHAEVEVVSIDDVTFAARRLQADPNTPEGREKLSRELGIDAWLDGEVTESTAQLTLTAGDGTVLQEVNVETEDVKHLDALTGERMWAVLGPSLSVQEAYRRALLAEYDRARAKYEARMYEQQRQVTLAHQARAHRAFILRAQFSLAQRKQAALSAELTHQTQLGKAELAREAEMARQAELARQAEIAHKAELARQAELARKAEIARKAEAAKAAELARKAEIARKAEAAKAAEQARKAEAKAAAAAKKAELAQKAEDAKTRKSEAAEQAKNRRLAAAQAAADKKAKVKQDRELAKRKAAKKRGLGNTGLTNTGAQRVQQAKAQAKKQKARAKQATSDREESPRRGKGRTSAAVGGKTEADLLSRQ